MVLKVTAGTIPDITIAEDLLLKAVFCRPNDCRRVATRYDKLARNDASTLANATIVAYWT